MFKKLCALLFFVFIVELGVAGVALAKVNINTADAAELDTLPEVGLPTAAKIIAYRELHGPFATIEDLRNVSGFGGEGKTFDKVKNYITVSDKESVAENDSEESVENSDEESGNEESDMESTSFKKKQKFQVGMGRERTVSVGAPVEFEAEVSGGEQARFQWSFGDGTSKRGKKATHRFRFPGKYVVVLNAESGGQKAVAKAMVTAIDPNLSVTEINSSAGYVKIVNKEKREVNLGGFKLEVYPEQGREMAFVFPADTIITADAEITFPLPQNLLKPENDSMTLNYPDGRTKQEFALARESSDSDLVVLHQQLLALVARAPSQPPPKGEAAPSPLGRAGGGAVVLEAEQMPQVIELAPAPGTLKKGVLFLKSIFK